MRTFFAAASVLAVPVGASVGQELPVFSVEPTAVDRDEAASLLAAAAAPAAELRRRGDLRSASPRRLERRPVGPLSEAPPQIRSQDLRLADAEPVAPNVAVLTEGTLRAEIDEAGGGLYLADRARLFSLEAVDLLDEEAAVARARSLLERANLLDGGDRVRFDVRAVTGTGYRPDGGRSVTTERIVTFGASVETELGPVPVTGGGSEYGVALGEGGAVVSVVGAFRPVRDVIGRVSVRSPDAAINAFEAGANQKYADLKATLAYYAAPGFERQTEMRPVYVISGAMVGGQPVPIKNVLLDAVSLRPIFEGGADLPPQRDKERFDGDDPRGGDEGERQFGLLDLLFPPAYAQEVNECGTDWIAESQELSATARNAADFQKACRDEGWQVNFAWGDLNAWSLDFIDQDDRYADTVDLMFYTGHAWVDGWTTTEPGTSNRDDVRWTDMASGQDHWGSGDLEWLFVAACGPLQDDDFMPRGGNAFDRWRGAFDGLHNFFGYGAETYDLDGEAKRLMALARQGVPLHEAWFRAAREVQPATNTSEAPYGPDIYVVDMYAHSGDHCAKTETLHGRGKTCRDVRGARQQRHLWWQGT